MIPVVYAPSMEETNRIEGLREAAARIFPCPSCGMRRRRPCDYSIFGITGGRCHTGRYQLAIDAGVVPWIRGFRRAGDDTPPNVHPAAGVEVSPGGDPGEDYPLVVAVEAREALSRSHGSLLASDGG